MVSVLFKKRVQHHLVAKPYILSSLWMRHCFLFHMLWLVIVYGGQIIIDDRLFSFSFLFSSLPDIIFSFLFLFLLFSLLSNKMHDCPLYFWLFNFNFCSFDFLFCSYFFIKVFFQFSSLITISRIYVFYSILIPLIFFPL